MIIYYAKIMFIIESEHVCVNYLPRSCQDVMMYHIVLWLCLLKCKAGTTIFMWFSISSFILTQYTDLHARSLFFFSIPMWLTWRWSSACVFNILGVITCLAFIMILSITAMSSWNVQYVLISHGIWSLFSGHPMMMYPFSHCK